MPCPDLVPVSRATLRYRAPQPTGQVGGRGVSSFRCGMPCRAVVPGRCPGPRDIYEQKMYRAAEVRSMRARMSRRLRALLWTSEFRKSRETAARSLRHDEEPATPKAPAWGQRCQLRLEAQWRHPSCACAVSGGDESPLSTWLEAGVRGPPCGCGAVRSKPTIRWVISTQCVVKKSAAQEVTRKVSRKYPPSAERGRSGSQTRAPVHRNHVVSGESGKLKGPVAINTPPRRGKPPGP